MRAFGINGYGWTSTAIEYTSISYATAYVFGFNDSGSNPSSGLNDHWTGYPIRRQGDLDHFSQYLSHHPNIFKLMRPILPQNRFFMPLS